jgi:hypothetical protein
LFDGRLGIYNVNNPDVYQLLVKTRKISSLPQNRRVENTQCPPPLPHPFFYVEADLKGKKPFKKAVTRTNVTGACGLALVRCGELAFSSLGKESELMVRLSDAISGESPQDADSLLQLLRDTKEDLSDIRKGLSEIANVGSEIAAGSFNQGVDELRHLIW